MKRLLSWRVTVGENFARHLSSCLRCSWTAVIFSRPVGKKSLKNQILQFLQNVFIEIPLRVYNKNLTGKKKNLKGGSESLEETKLK